MATASTLSQQCYPISIDAQLFGISVQPAQRRVIVLERSGEPGLGRKPVVDGHDRTPLCGGEQLQRSNAFRGTAHYIAATMNVKHPGPDRSVCRRADHDDVHVRSTCRARNHSLKE